MASSLKQCIVEQVNYFRHILVIDGSDVIRSPGKLVVYDPQPRCYNIQVGHHPEAGQYFYYGRPGKSDQCPWKCIIQDWWHEVG